MTEAPDALVGAAAELMLQKGIGCFPVIGGTSLVGIVTKTDLLRYLRSLST